MILQGIIEQDGFDKCDSKCCQIERADQGVLKRFGHVERLDKKWEIRGKTECKRIWNIKA